MTRVKIFVEGQTEETFVRDVLEPYFSRQNIYLTAILARTSSSHKGGIVSYGKVKHQITRLCWHDSQAHVTTMIDYYALPTDFPGFAQLPQGNAEQRAQTLEERFSQDIDEPNFIPNFLLHEFEALLFCQPEKFVDWLDDKRPIAHLQEIKAQFGSPEQINDGPETAPSKRLVAAIPDYRKTLHGPLIAADIGLDAIRAECPHFNRWLQCIEALPRQLGQS